jgi:bifunctional UDP-N-acetylglucosamine pyrophosphorylase/glucosamine-1-phosphate N-acetyltransferase
MNHIIILAAGKGTRMKSELPKVLHPLAGVPMIKQVIKVVEPISPKPTLIVGHKAEDVIAATSNSYDYVVQKEQLGTGHAIMCAAPELKDKGYENVVVLMGDHPLITTRTINELIDLQNATESAITLVTIDAPNFEGDNTLFMQYGRVIRNAEGTVDRIVEYKDATEEERAVKEVNFGTYCFNAQWLWENIDKLSNNNAAQEYYITDMIKMAIDQGKKVSAYTLKDIKESYGVNTPEQLQYAGQLIAERV